MANNKKIRGRLLFESFVLLVLLAVLSFVVLFSVTADLSATMPMQQQKVLRTVREVHGASGMQGIGVHIAAHGGHLARGRDEMEGAKMVEKHGMDEMDEMDEMDAAAALEHTLQRVYRRWRECDSWFFLHIAKTGGHSIDEILLEAEKEGIIGSVYSHYGYMSKVWTVRNWLRGNESFDLCSNRYGSGECSFSALQEAGLEQEHTNRTCFVSAVRDPERWLPSALHQGRYMRRKLHLKEPPWRYKYFETQNFQTSFFEGIMSRGGHSLTVVSLEASVIQSMLLHHIRSTCDLQGKEMVADKVHAYSRSHAEFDWREVVNESYALDKEFHALVTKHSVIHLEFDSPEMNKQRGFQAMESILKRYKREPLTKRSVRILKRNTLEWFPNMLNVSPLEEYNGV